VRGAIRLVLASGGLAIRAKDRWWYQTAQTMRASLLATATAALLCDDSIHSSDANPIFVMGALYVLGAAFVYGMSSLLTRGAIDGHRVPLGAVAAGAMLGLLAGLVLVRFEPISGALILAVAGGFSGTVIRQRGVSSGNERE